MGEEDILNDQSKNYACSCRCISQRAKVYRISRDHFMYMKQQPAHFMLVMKQLLQKDARKRGAQF